MSMNMDESYITSKVTTSHEYFLNVPSNGVDERVPLGSRTDSLTVYPDSAEDLPLTGNQLEQALGTLADSYLESQLASRRFVALRRGVSAAAIAAAGVTTYEGVSNDSAGIFITGAGLGIAGLAFAIRGERTIDTEKRVRSHESGLYRKQVLALTSLIAQKKTQNQL